MIGDDSPRQFPSAVPQSLSSRRGVNDRASICASCREDVGDELRVPQHGIADTLVLRSTSALCVRVIGLKLT
jgi:hypothetical protein